MSKREVGVVKWFNANKGFGFILNEAGEEIFVHYSAIEGEGFRMLIDGMKVEYRVEETERGKQARSVNRIQDDHSTPD